MESLWKHTKKYLPLVAFGVLLYELCENLPAVRHALAEFFSILQPLFIGVAFAFIVNMPMRFFEKRVFTKWKQGGAKRGVCLLLSYLLVVAVITAMLLLIVPRMIESGTSILVNFDSYMTSLGEWADDMWTRLNLREDVVQTISDAFVRTFGQLDEIVADAAGAALRGAVSAIGLIANILIAFILSFYTLFNKEKLLMQSRRVVNAIFEEKTAHRILEICTRANIALNSYFIGLIIDCFLLGSMCFIAMTIFGFPYALLISATIGFTQVVPIVGPWLGGVVGALLIFFVNPPLAPWFVVLLLTVQQIDNNLVYPRIMGNAVGLSGIWVLIAILLGGGLWGLGGIVLSVPLMAVCYTIGAEWVNKRLERKRQ